MKRPFIKCLVASALTLAATAAFAGSYDNVLPKPQSVKVSSGVYHHPAGAEIKFINKAGIAKEGYNIRIGRRGIKVLSSDASGLYYALQTLSQMSGVPLGSLEDKEWEVDCCTIKDEPRFPYRGLHLDISRHFRDKEFIMKQIDAMAKVKLNRLHLHLCDSEGWRIEISSYPLLTEVAAWRPIQFNNDWRRSDRKYSDSEHGFGGFLTKEDVHEIVLYAAERHVDIVPEIDLPGHSREVCAVYPQLSCSGIPYENNALCPGKEETFRFIEKVLGEVIDMFPSKYIHIGGDEVNKRAWSECPDCRRRMQEEGLKDVEELQSYTISRIERFVESRGRHIIGWDEILQGGLAPKATVMSWRGVEGGSKATELGHDAIMTPAKYCYIDAAQDKPDKEPAAYGVYLPLEKIYGYNPTEDIPDPKHIIGVQANLWSEYIVSDAYAEYMTWPRGLAIAEIGWTRPENKKGYTEFRERALKVNERMKEEGYSVFDLSTEAGNRPEYNIPVEHLAKGCKVTYDNGCKWRSYPAAGEATFTDGLRGGWSYRDDRWQGFLGNIEVTVDLGCLKTVRHIGTDFYEKGFEMHAPALTRFEVSEDGTNFRTVAELVDGRPVPEHDRRGAPRTESPAEKPATIHVTIPSQRGTKVEFIEKSADFDPVDVRYVRLKTERGKFGGWIFLDEIVVL